MITRVLLRNWRGYEKLGLDFGEGLTFVIADNGVGKTSLVNGVAWAIFGAAAGVDGAAAIRAGTDEALAEVDLVLGDREVSVSRTLRRDARGRSLVTAEVDGRQIDASELPSLLAEAAGVPHDILPPLMFVPEMRLTHEGELFADVQDHLAALLGIDDLRAAARTAQDVHAGAVRDIRAARDIERIDRRQIEATRSLVEEMTAELAELDTALDRDGEQRAGLDAALRRLDDWNRYDRQMAQYRERLADLAEQARAVGLGPDPEYDQVAEAEEQADREARQLSATLVEVTTEESLVTGLIEQLGSADAVCPVCLRTIDEDIAAHATRVHQARLAELAAREADLERRRHDVDEAAARLAALATALARLHPPEPPDDLRPDEAEADLLARRAELDAAMAERMDRRGALGEQLRQAEATLREAERSQTATAELTVLHGVAAAASALAELARAEADARTEQSLDPLSQTLARRWGEFFVASSSRPRLAGGGSIELGLGGGGESTIPYTSFSGGEKTLASLLTRLLFVTSATSLRSMWLDEPLEHLDPANRTRVARLLAQVTEPGNHMRQVVVTTYEEGLARSMIERHAPTSIVYVSTDDLL